LITRSMVFLGKMKVFPLVLCIIMVLAGLCACAQNSNTNNTTQTGPVKIGVSVSLTGDASADGKAIQQGYQLWQDYVNKNGGLLGHQVQMIFYDDATRPEQARINYQKLIAVDKVNFVLGPFDDAFTVNGAEVAAKYGYSFIQGTGTSPQDFTHGLTNMFSVSLSASRYMASLVNYILSLPTDMRPKTVAYVTSDDGFTSAQVLPVIPQLQQGGLTTVVNKIYPAENTDLNPIAASVVASHADVAILGTSALSECVTYLKFFASQHYNPKILIATSGPDQGSAFTDAVGVKNAEGVLVANGGWWPTVKTYQNDIFVPAFIQKFGGGPNDIGSDSVQAFSVGQVLQQTINQTHSLDNAKIITALHTGTFQSLQGPVKFSADGQNTLALPYLFQWQNGQLIPVYPQSQAQTNLEFPKPAWSS
jgi:branched-chain amino acid transport system substrate-binding protein